MIIRPKLIHVFTRFALSCVSALSLTVGSAFAFSSAPVLDPTTIPKYVTPLLIPPEMPKSTTQPCSGTGCPAATYNLATRQFLQQMLPGGPWNTLTGRKDAFPPTPVWGYGRQEDPVAPVAPAPVTTTTFNSPSLTVENQSGATTSVRWINELVAIDPTTGKPFALGSGQRTYLNPLTPIDPTLHWTNPGKALCLSSVPGGAPVSDTDCTPDPTLLPVGADGKILPYLGPVTNVTHVHGADVTPDSDGYAEAWYLPAADNIPASFAIHGRQYDQNNRANAVPGSAYFAYPNTQPPTTLWYHDHSLGITHNNVYSGTAGFWMIRANPASTASLYKTEPVACSLPGSFNAFGRATNPANTYNSGFNCTNTVAATAATAALVAADALKGINPATSTAPGCDPNFDLTCRAAIRDIPIVMADRSFHTDGTLFYSGDRTDASPSNIPVPYAPVTDIAPIINPEFFAVGLTVNGMTYPQMQVASQRYRFRFLDGADARSFNLSLWSLSAAQQKAAHKLLIAANGVDGTLPNEAYQGKLYAGTVATVTFAKGTELPFYQIGAEQGLLPKVVKIKTGAMLVLPGAPSYDDPVMPVCTPATATTAASNPQDPNCERGLLVTPAERADTIVDFTPLSAGATVRLINAAQDSPFQGFPIMDPPPTPLATDQLMEFNVVAKFTNALNTAGVVPPVDLSTPPTKLDLKVASEAPLVAPKNVTVRSLTLQEYESQDMCANSDPITGNVTQVAVFPTLTTTGFDTVCASALPSGEPYGPRIDMLGQLAVNAPVSYHWADPITQTPALNVVQEWDVYNFTPDSHPIHVHGTRFQIIGRESLVPDPATDKAAIPATPSGVKFTQLPTEAGYKDTLDALPRSKVRMLATFTRPGLYQWHCHITEHEDNEMMLPMCVVPAGTSPTACAAPNGSLVGTGSAVPPPVAISTVAK